MALPADRGLRPGAANAPVAADEIDAGWDSVPESGSPPVVSAPLTSARALAPARVTSKSTILGLGPKSATARSARLSPPPKPTTSRPPARASVLPPVVSVPRPRSWTGAPPPIESVRDEDWDIEEVRGEVANVAPVKSKVSYAPSVGPVTREVHVPVLARRKTGNGTFVTLVGIAAALAVGAAAFSFWKTPGESPASVAAARAPAARLPERVAEPEPAPPVPSPAAPSSSEAVQPALAVETAAEPAPEKPSASVAVTIKTVPEAAVVFRARQRLGAGVVEVNVERHAKQRFTALLDGHVPANFTLDGSRDSVTIRLKRAPRPQAKPAAESAATGNEPNAANGANAATAPAPTAGTEPTVAPEPMAAPAPESTATATPSVNVSTPPASLE
jgi:hypothetical protein